MRTARHNAAVAARIEEALDLARREYPDATALEPTYFADTIYVAVFREWPDGTYGKQHVLTGEVLA